MKNIVNEVKVEGYLYTHELKLRHSDKNNTDYINGKVSIATDEACTNIVDCHFIYVTPTYSKSGKTNRNFGLLQNIIDSEDKKTVMGAGKENALKIKVDGSIGVNDFWAKNEDAMVSVARVEANFISNVNALNDNEAKRNEFKTDFLITNTFRKEADEERNVPEHLVVKGAVFNSFSKALIPISYVVHNPAAMDYFEGLEASTSAPVFTKVWGQICSQEFISKIVTKSAFDEDLVEERKTTKKEYVIKGAQSDCYAWDSEDTILASELKKAMADRELHLAEVKRNYDEYQASKDATTTASSTNVASGDFNF